MYVCTCVTYSGMHLERAAFGRSQACGAPLQPSSWPP